MTLALARNSVPATSHSAALAVRVNEREEQVIEVSVFVLSHR
jgi:hypothetical protein